MGLGNNALDLILHKKKSSRPRYFFATCKVKKIQIAAVVKEVDFSS